MKLFSFLLLHALLYLFACNNLYAQQHHLYFDQLNIQKGLPESSVRSIREDRQGYIWMGTQNGLVRYDGYKYKVYNPGTDSINKAPVTNISSLLIDKNDVVWVSVIANGLFRYDRHTDTFKQFPYPGKDLLSNFYILNADDLGNIWGRGYSNNSTQFVWKLNIKNNAFELFGNHEKGNNYFNASIVYAVFKSLSGDIWFTTENGIYRYQGQNKPLKGYMTSSDTAKQTGLNPVYEAPSEPGVFWMNSFHGYNIDLRATRFDTRNNTFKDYRPGKDSFSLFGANITDIYEDKRKRLWFGTKQALTKLDRKTEKFTNYFLKDPAKSFENGVSEFVETKDGCFWLTSPAGLVYFDPVAARFEQYLPDENNAGSITSGNIVTKMLDHTNTLWLGLNYAGANKLNKLRSTFTLYKKLPGKPNSYPGNGGFLAAGKNGYCWFTTATGIYKWFPGTNDFKRVYSAIANSQYISKAFESSDGKLYIGSTAGLLVYDTHGGKQELFKSGEQDTTSLSSNYVNDIFEDHTGAIWLAAGNSGICSFNPKTKKFTRYPYRKNRENITANNEGALDDETVLSIYEDRQNTLWVGTNNGGLNRFDRKTGRFASYLNEKNRKMECVINIYEDLAGRLWVGTYLSGLFEFDRKKGVYTHQFNEQSGLLFNSCLGLNEDSDGRIWLFSQRGLSRINPQNFSVKNFTLENVLPGDDVINLQHILSKLNDGRFILSLKNGMALFDPKDLTDNPFPPLVHLEDITYSNPHADDKIVTHALAYGRTSIDLPYNQNQIQFSYVALHYDNPGENTYAFKLDGYDKNWVQAGTQRTATYTNLSAGTYTFHVKAANSDGVWSTKDEKITVVISPPWWRTWWAYIMYALFFGAALRAYIIFRSRSLRRRNRLLEEKVQHRTHQLSESNEELKTIQEQIVAQRDELAQSVDMLKTTQAQLIQSEKMASLGELTAGIAHEIQNPLNFVNNFSEVNTELIEELKSELLADNKEEAISIAEDIKENEQKINHHGKRADGIVKGMLQHSRASTGKKELTDINALADEYLRLSYHGLRAKDKNFNADFKTHFDDTIGKINVVTQDIGRVLLNLFNNAFYAVNEKKKLSANSYQPIAKVTTRKLNDKIEIRVEDNGDGIPSSIKEKIFQPFFTTKPTGEGTGLGLSLTYDMVVKGHGGSIQVNSVEGERTEFIIILPLR